MPHVANRLETRLAALKAANKKAFVAFATAGFPDLEAFPDLLAGLANAGADIIEVGMPFSDPMADGPIVQAANLRAFKAGITVRKTLDFVADFRKTNKETPIVLMGYYNPIYSHGVRTFIDDAKKAGVDALIVPDLPPEEDEELRKPAAKGDIILIRFVTPTTDAERLPKILKCAKGFLYYTSIAGITGSKQATADAVRDNVAAIKAKTDLPVFVGFGITTPAQVKSLGAVADGVIVGSAIMSRLARQIDEEGLTPCEAAEDALTFVTELVGT